MFNLFLAAAPVINATTQAAAPVVNTAAQGAAPAVNAVNQAMPAVNAATQAGSAMSGAIMHYLLLSVYLLVCIGLIIAVLVQTTKSEGLSGIIGGATQSIFRGKKSIEEKLNQFTTYLAVAFIALSIAISFWGFR